MFVDKESILIKAGDGGDGGSGGNVIFVGDKHKTSLLDFQFKHKFFAEDGQKGDTKNCTGRRGEDIIIPLPLGTVVKDAETENIISKNNKDILTILFLFLPKCF